MGSSLVNDSGVWGRSTYDTERYPIGVKLFRSSYIEVLTSLHRTKAYIYQPHAYVSPRPQNKPVPQCRILLEIARAQSKLLKMFAITLRPGECICGILTCLS